MAFAFSAALRATVWSQLPPTVPPQRGCLAHQHEEGGLETIFCISIVAENTPANAQDHRPMPLHQSLEGIIVSLAKEKLQQFSIVSRAAVM